jgi:hypothetical protein
VGDGHKPERVDDEVVAELDPRQRDLIRLASTGHPLGGPEANSDAQVRDDVLRVLFPEMPEDEVRGLSDALHRLTDDDRTTLAMLLGGRRLEDVLRFGGAPLPGG